GHQPRAGERPAASLDGRAVRGARRDDARADEPRSAADLARERQDRVAHHPQHSGSGLSRRPRRCHDPAPGKSGAHRRGRLAAPALDRRHGRPLVRSPDRRNSPTALRLRNRQGRPAQWRHLMTVIANELPRAESQGAPPGAFTLLMRTRPELVLAPTLLVVILAVWEWGVPYFEVPSYVLPTPSAIGIALWRGIDAGLFERGGYWLHTGVTLAEVLLGFVIGAGVGLILGTI